MVKTPAIYELVAQEVPCTDNQGILSNVQDEIRKSSHLLTGGIDSTTDWNNITTPGVYPKLIGYQNANAPRSGYYFYCMVFKYSNVALTQIAIPYSTALVNNDLYVRTLYGTTWSNWAKMSGVRYAKDGTSDVTSLPYVAGAATPTYKVLFSVKVDNLKPSDVIDLDGMFEVTNDNVYSVMVAYGIIQASSPTSTSGAYVAGLMTEYVSHDQHHFVGNLSGIDTGVSGTAYYNLVAFASQASYTGSLKVEQNYGALIAKVL